MKKSFFCWPPALRTMNGPVDMLHPPSLPGDDATMSMINHRQVQPVATNTACFYVGLIAAQGRAAVGHQADARPHHTSRSAHMRQCGADENQIDQEEILLTNLARQGSSCHDEQGWTIDEELSPLAESVDPW